MIAWTALLFAAFLQAAAPSAKVETVHRDGSSGIEDARQVVVRTAGEWTKLWREHGGNQPEPRIDFATRTVIAIFLGTRPSAGYAVEIVGTRADGAGLVVEWREGKPERGMVAAQIMTAPAHIVSVPKVSGPIRVEQAGQ